MKNDELAFISFNTLREMYTEALRAENESEIRQLQSELMKRVYEEEKLLKRKSSIFGMREESTIENNPLID